MPITKISQKKCIVLFVFFVVILGAIFFWKKIENSQVPYNVVLITIDTLRADHLGCYGYWKAETPNIDRLASKGVVFRRAYSQSPLTLPSHASLLTGTNPTFHGIRDNNWYRLPSDIPTMATILKSYGYRTSAVVSASPLSREKGLCIGFDEYSDVADSLEEMGGNVFIPERKAEQSVALALENLSRFEETPGTPFFLWLHLFDPHAQYQPPSPFSEKFSHSPYDGEIAYVDHCLKKLFDRIEKVHPHTMVILTADHGEGLGEHGEPSHGYFLYNSTLHVPLIFYSPGNIPPRNVVSPTIRSIDIMPTTLSFLGIAERGMASGSDFSAFLLPSSTDLTSFPSLPSYAETYFPHHAFGWRVLRSIIWEGYKYIDSLSPELYSLSTDPKETQNLLGESLDAHAQIQGKKLKAILQSIVSEKKTRNAFTSASEKQELESLGYYSYPEKSGTSEKNELPEFSDDSQSPRKEENDMPDPMQRKDMIQLFVTTQSLLRSGLPEREKAAIVNLSEIVAKDPNNATCWALLGKAYTRQGQWDKAEEAFRKFYQLRPYLRVARLSLLDSLTQQQKFSAARKLLENFLQQNPNDGWLWARYAFVQFSLRERGEGGSYKEVAKAAQKAVLFQPRSPNAWFYLGRSLQEERQFTQACSALEQATKLSPQWPEARHYYALSLWQTGNPDKAQAIWDTLLTELKPNDPLRSTILQIHSKDTNASQK